MVEVKDRLFAKPNVKLDKGDSLKYYFTGNELHNLTLANGPLGIGSDNLNANRVFNQKFTRTGTYRSSAACTPCR